MKIVLAFDSFKGCITAGDACHTAAQAILDVCPEAEVVECPMSDGGEGLVDCVEKPLPVQRITVKAHDPLMNSIDASYVITADGNTAYMEMAVTSGLTLVEKNKRNPMLTTTYGVGDMLIDAAHRGCKEVVMGIGGSATCDAGKGMVQCLKDNGYVLPGQDFPHITIASDVTNPLYGAQGAAYIFAPQKGATPEQVKLLDQQLRMFAQETEKAGLATPELALHPGAGAAGGLGYGLMAYLNAEMKSGVDILLDLKNFDVLVENADYVITGEGKSDQQTLMGKVPQGVMLRTSKEAKVWLLSGCVDDENGALIRSFSVVKSINEGDNRPLDVLMQPAVAKENMTKTIKQLFQDKDNMEESRETLVFNYLRGHQIPFECYHHPEGKSIEEAKRWWKNDGSVHCKNIFMRNHKGNQHYLICFDCDYDLDIHDLEARLKAQLQRKGLPSCGKLSFASAERMLKYLGLEPGSVSPFGLINDTENHVHLFLDAHLQEAETMSFHPNDCRGTVVIRKEDFERYLAVVGNTYEYMELY